MTSSGSNWSSGTSSRGRKLREDRTFAYALTDRSRDNIRNLVLDPAVEDTHEIDRTAFRVEDAAPWLPYVTPSPGIPMGLEFLSVLGFLCGLASISLGFLERTDYRVLSRVMATVNRRLKLRGVIPDLTLAAVALLGIALIATGSITFGSVLGNWVYPIEESDLSVRGLLILALVLPTTLAGVHYGNRWIDSRQELVLALWFILGTGAVFAIRWLYPFSLGTVVQSDKANSFYSPTLTYSAFPVPQSVRVDRSGPCRSMPPPTCPVRCSCFTFFRRSPIRRRSWGP